MTDIKVKRAGLKRRQMRLRKRLMGTPERPRLSVYRSLKYIYAQVIDDVAGRTLAAASDVEKTLAAARDGKKKMDVATAVGDLIARRAREKGVEQVVFDRGGYRFHGRVKALAEAARKAGLRF